MKATTIVKISPQIDITSPTLLQCKTGECGGCPNGTGKMLWVPKHSQYGENFVFDLQYNFFNKTQESEAPIKYNCLESSTAFGDRPTKQYAINTRAIESSPPLSPSQMRNGDSLSWYNDVYQSQSVGCWVFFRQPNPAVGNVHDALCFEYNNEKRLITFRSF